MGSSFGSRVSLGFEGRDSHGLPDRTHSNISGDSLVVYLLGDNLSGPGQRKRKTAQWEEKGKFSLVSRLGS